MDCEMHHKMWRGAIPLGWVLIIGHQIAGLLLVIIGLGLSFASALDCSDLPCTDPTNSYVVVASLLWVGVGTVAAANLLLAYRMRAGRTSGTTVAATTTATLLASVAAGCAILLIYSV
jgi:hypothetical protein